MELNKERLQGNIQHNKNEGGTYTLSGGVKEFKSGYMVGITKLIDRQLNKSENDIYTLAQVAKLVEQLEKSTIKAIYGNVFIGFGKEGNKIYYDIVVRINTKKEALEIAKKGKELAIGDNKNLKEINI